MPTNPNEITVRYGNGTYTARCQGKTASRTSCAKSAAEAVAEKIVGHPCAVVRVVRVDGDERWRIEK